MSEPDNRDYVIRRRIIEALESAKSLDELADTLPATDSRLLWHLRQMEDDGHVREIEPSRWIRTDKSLPDASSSQAISEHIVGDFSDALLESEDGLYGDSFVLVNGEHRTRLSHDQAVEFQSKLKRLVEEYFAPGRGNREGFKYGLHWILSPIDLHPLDDD